VRHSNDRSFGDISMSDQGTFDLSRAHPVTRYIDDIVDPASDPIIPILVPTAAVPSEVHAGEGGEIGLEEALMIAPHCPHLARPAIGNGEASVARALD
jgi:hypothetical protein